MCLSLSECVCATYADPRVFEGLRGSDAFARIDCQHLVDQIFGLRSYSVPLWGWELSKKQTTAQWQKLITLIQLIQRKI